LSFLDFSVGVRVETLMSIEGLGKAMNGERAYLDINDGRTLAVDVLITSATSTAAERGELFGPVTLLPPAGSLTEADIGKAASLRLSRTLIDAWFQTGNGTHDPHPSPDHLWRQRHPAVACVAFAKPKAVPEGRRCAVAHVLSRGGAAPCRAGL